MKSVKQILPQYWKLIKQEASGTVYIHWPYCSQLCTYCNFNKYVRNKIDEERMTKCLIQELTNLLTLSGIKTVTSMYFGGGTPSLAKPDTVEAVISSIEEKSMLASGAEITLEANPTSAQTNKLRSAFKMAGVTRLSIGVQSFVDEELKLMNRDHSVAEAEHCLSEAHKLFPDHVNIDVIFGRPHQTVSNWMTELKQAVCGNHVSLYQLTVEQGTALAKAVNRNEVVLPNDDIVADMYAASIKMLDQVGLKRYEISNFCVPGYESRHNLSYWQGGNYLGIGPGAHSRFCRSSQKSHFTHSINTLEPNAWMAKVTVRGHGMQKIGTIGPYERLEEVVSTSMRTTEGLTTEIWERFEVPVQLQHVFSSTCNSHPLAKHITNGLLVVDDCGVRATDKGLNVLDSVLPELLACLNLHIQS